MLTGVAVFGSACEATRDVGLTIGLPSAIRETTAWFEVGAFKNAKCSAVEPMLGNGIPEGAAARLAFQPKEGAPASFGDIPNASYAFAAVARSSDCSVLARGCVDAEVDDIDTVRIVLNPSDGESGKCPAGASCLAGRCAPANRNDDPSVGANCSLELVGSGPLTTPAGPGSVISAPAIAATPTGFFIAYREVSGNGANINILPIDFAGGAAPPLRPRLQNPCLTSDETDGVGLVFDGDDGMVALAKSPCGAAPELQLLNFTSKLTVGRLLVSAPTTGQRVTMGAAHPAAVRRGKSHVVVYSEQGTAKIAALDKDRGIVGPNGTFGGTQDVTDAWVATSASALALLAARSGTLALLVTDVNREITEFDAANGTPNAPFEFPGAWGSLAAVGGRVIVLSDGDGPGRSVSYRTFDLNRPEPGPVETNGFSIEGSGKVTAGDVALVGDRAYFAVLRRGAVALHVYDHATTKPQPLHSVSFAHEARISGVNTVQDGRVAVAANESRVAVVWTTNKVLQRNDTTGWYAVFACTE